MVFRYFSFALISTTTLSLLACGTVPVVPVQTEETLPAEAEVPLRIADRSFSADTLYALLVAELALSRQRHDIALGNYVQQALETQDAGVAEHATHLARMLRAQDEALQMAKLWSDVEPQNLEARHLYASGLVQAQRFEDAFEQARLLVEAGEAAAFEDLAANAAEGSPEVRVALADKYRELLETHPDNVNLLVGYSLLQEQLNQPEEALKSVRRALEVESGSVTALYQEARLLQVLGESKLAMEKMGKLVAANPDNHRLRLRYARALVDTDLSAAHQQYLELYKQLPFDQDVIFTLALIERELQMYDTAAERFYTLIARQQHVSAAHYQLGKIYEEQNRPDKALPHYLDVGDDSNYVAAISHASRILVAEGKEQDALLLVQQRRSAQPLDNRSGLYMLEAELLSQGGNNSGAEKILSEGLKHAPGNTSLLYARAMLYARIDVIDAAEQDLLAILEKQPNDAAALNALGYTLADKTDRLEEAHDYIARALAITPNDPAVLDSMGWVYYRKGRMQEALTKLRQAMEAMPDHEVAAHLGEVLWVTGVHDEAKKVWRSGLELNPRSQIIHQTILRLNATLN